MVLPATSPAPPCVWITGAGGLIGSHLLASAPRLAPGWHVIGLTRSRLDLTDVAAVREQFRRDRPSLVIHCAAFSRSPACQADPARARRENVEVTRHLADLAAEGGFVFLSTDLVFDGRKAEAYVETDSTNPLSIYAETKVEAERAVLANPRHTVIRTSLNGGASPTGDRGFNEELRRAWQSGAVPRLFTDEFRCPIPAIETARALWEIALARPAGLFHLAGSKRLSRWEIGQLVAARCPELNPRCEPSSIRDYRGAPRPANLTLDCSKVAALLTFPLPALDEWLASHPEVLF